MRLEGNSYYISLLSTKSTSTLHRNNVYSPYSPKLTNVKDSHNTIKIQTYIIALCRYCTSNTGMNSIYLLDR